MKTKEKVLNCECEDKELERHKFLGKVVINAHLFLGIECYE